MNGFLLWVAYFSVNPVQLELQRQQRAHDMQLAAAENERAALEAREQAAAAFLADKAGMVAKLTALSEAREAEQLAANKRIMWASFS